MSFKFCSPPTGFHLGRLWSTPVESSSIDIHPIRSPLLKQNDRISLAHYVHTRTHTRTDTHAKTLYHEPRHTRTAQGLRSHTRNFFGHSLPRRNNFLAAVWTSTNTLERRRLPSNRLGSKSLVCVAQMLFAAQERLEGRRTSIGLGSGPLSLLRQRSPNESEETTQPSRKREAKGIYIRWCRCVSIGKRRYTLRQS